MCPSSVRDALSPSKQVCAYCRTQADSFSVTVSSVVSPPGCHETVPVECNVAVFCSAVGKAGRCRYAHDVVISSSF